MTPQSDASAPEDFAGRLAALEERVQSLEAQVAGVASPAHSPDSDAEPSSADTFWALEGLKKHVPTPNGAVMMVGSVTTPNGDQADWQYGETTDALFDRDFGDTADVLSAIAQPTRLQLLQRLLTDAKTVNDLLATGQFGTSGQIYHHLRPLVSAGWLRQTGRGNYEVPAHRLVPLLTILIGAQR
ncbi:MAG: ArsR family transcriptional regulator [Gulosibacter sp.]|uniref:ArsR family transcriptional regulator n=1 Tax=Gulosibacter sp. TaxID=2817531 RepID=UPI003F933C58